MDVTDQLVKKKLLSLQRDVVPVEELLKKLGYYSMDVVLLLATLQYRLQRSMEVLIQRPLPVGTCVKHEGVVVVEEAHGGEEQHDAYECQCLGQSAQEHDAPDDDQQATQREVHAQAGRIAEGLVLEPTHNLVRHHPRGQHGDSTEQIVGQGTEQGDGVAYRCYQGVLVAGR